MIIEAVKNRLYIDNELQPRGSAGELVNLDTMQTIPFAFRANTETGDWRAFATLPNNPQEMERPVRIISGRCRLKWVPRQATPIVKKRANTPAEEVAEIRTIAKDYGVQYERIDAEVYAECDEPKCHRQAVWAVSHEQEIDPGIQADGINRCERAVCVAVNSWCERHWRPPTMKSVRGVEEEIEVGARPQ